MLRFWFDRGVDGIRVDAAPALAKAPGLPDADYGDDLRFVTIRWTDNPHWDVDAVHDVFRRWRRIADEYPGDRQFVAEAVVNGAERLGRYLRPDELHTAFNFPYLKAPWDADALRSVIDDTLATFLPIGAPPTWALSSHDEVRLVTRFGRATTSAAHFSDGAGEVSDPVLGTRRARAAALLMLALPGSAYLYQGEELGLPEVLDLPERGAAGPDLRAAPAGRAGGGTAAGCRCRGAGTLRPMDSLPTACARGCRSLLDWGPLTVEAQAADPDSTLSLHRAALRIRRSDPALAGLDFAWLDAPEGVLAFSRGAGFRCVVNLSPAPVPVGDGEVLLTSGPLADGLLPSDTAAWIRPAAAPTV